MLILHADLAEENLSNSPWYEDYIMKYDVQLDCFSEREPCFSESKMGLIFFFNQETQPTSAKTKLNQQEYWVKLWSCLAAKPCTMKVERNGK